MRAVDPRAAVVLVLGAVVASAATAVLWRFSVDDAAITYRVAEHISGGLGFSYNEGEPRQVTTTPLWAIVLAAASWLGVPVVTAAKVLSAVFLFAAGVAVGTLPAAATERSVPGLAAVVILVTTCTMLLSCLGMETALYLFLAATAVALAERGRDVPAGLLTGLLVLARADGILLAGWLALGALLRRRWSAWRGLVPVFLVGGLWMLAAWRLFGDPLPVTLSAKMAQGRSGYWGEGAIHLKGIGRWFGGFTREMPVYWGVPPLALWGLARGPKGLRPLLLLGGSVTLGYHLLGVPDYHWYYAPLAFGLLVAAAWGAALLPGRALPFLAVTLLAVGQLDMLRRRIGAFPPAPIVDYEAAGKLLARERGKTLAAAEIGVLGLTSGLRMCDWLGLACPEASELVAARRLDLFLPRFRPDLLLVHQPLWPIEEPLFLGEEARRYRMKMAVAGRAGTLAVLERGGPPALGPTVAISGPIGLPAGGPPADLPFSFEPSEHRALVLSARADQPGARLSLGWTTASHREFQEPFRVEVELAAESIERRYEIPIAGDGRFLAFGRVDRIRLEAKGSDIVVTSLAAGGGT